MIPWASVAASSAHMLCSAFGHAVTNAVTGPNGIAAALAMASHDDAAKESHECEVDYTLILTPDEATQVHHGSISFQSIDVWGRDLELRTDGFSASGDRVLGAIYESAEPAPEWDGGREVGGEKHTPSDFLLSFDKQRRMALFDASQSLSQLHRIKCGTSFRVIGTIGDTGIVAAPNTDDACHKNYRWSMAAPGAPLIALAPTAKFDPLYGEAVLSLPPSPSQR